MIIVALFLSSFALAANYTAISTEKVAKDFGAKMVVIIHYHRFDGKYTGWNLWVWPTKPVGISGSGYQFTHYDAYGPYAIIKFDEKYIQVGFIVRLSKDGNAWAEKDMAVNRYINIPSSGVAEIQITCK